MINGILIPINLHFIEKGYRDGVRHGRYLNRTRQMAKGNVEIATRASHPEVEDEGRVWEAVATVAIGPPRDGSKALKGGEQRGGVVDLRWVPYGVEEG